MNPVPVELRRKAEGLVVWHLLRTWLALLGLLLLARFADHFLTASALVVLIGALQYHLNILGHDGVHFNLFEDKKRNDWVTSWWILGPQGIPIKGVRASHLHHHRTVGTPEDRDRHYYDLTLLGRHTPAGLARWMVGCFTGGMFVPLVGKVIGMNRDKKTAAAGEGFNLREFVRLMMPVLVAQTVLVVVCWVLVGVFWAYAVFWFMPLVTFMFGFNSLRSCLEHACLESDPLFSREFSYLSHPVERFFLSPFNMNIHAEHHAYMSVPYYHLPALRAHLMKQDQAAVRRERSYLGRARQLFSELAARNTSSLRTRVAHE